MLAVDGTDVAALGVAEGFLFYLDEYGPLLRPYRGKQWVRWPEAGKGNVELSQRRRRATHNRLHQMRY